MNIRQRIKNIFDMTDCQYRFILDNNLTEGKIEEVKEQIKGYKQHLCSLLEFITLTDEIED